MKKEDCILFSGGAQGAEAEFGANAESFGIEEVNFTFNGHSLLRKRGLRVLNHEELKNGDVSLEYVSKLKINNLVVSFSLYSTRMYSLLLTNIDVFFENGSSHILTFLTYVKNWIFDI